MIEYLSEGLIVHSKIYYTLNRGKRVYTEEKPKKGTWFECEGYIYPPLLFSPKTWERWSYNKEDVKHTYDKQDASYVWQLPMILLLGEYEPQAASAGCRSTFQSNFGFLFMSRKTVFDSFLTYNIDKISKGPSVLCHKRQDHRVKIPQLLRTNDQFEQALKLVPDREPSFAWEVHYPTYFEFKDIKLVPINYDKDNDLILMHRIVEKKTWDNMIVKPKHCIVTMPSVIYVGKIPYVIVEEACFYYRVSKKRLVEKTSTVPKKRRKTK